METGPVRAAGMEPDGSFDGFELLQLDTRNKNSEQRPQRYRRISSRPLSSPVRANSGLRWGRPPASWMNRVMPAPTCFVWRDRSTTVAEFQDRRMIQGNHRCGRDSPAGSRIYSNR